MERKEIFVETNNKNGPVCLDVKQACVTDMCCLCACA